MSEFVTELTAVYGLGIEGWFGQLKFGEVFATYLANIDNARDSEGNRLWVPAGEEVK